MRQAPGSSLLVDPERFIYSTVQELFCDVVYINRELQVIVVT